MTTSKTSSPAIETTDAFAERLLSILNHEAIALMTSIGHRAVSQRLSQRRPSAR